MCKGYIILNVNDPSHFWDYFEYLPLKANNQETEENQEKANNQETEENQGKEAGNSSEFNSWTGNLAIAVCFKEAEDMEEARTQGEDEW